MSFLDFMKIVKKKHLFNILLAFCLSFLSGCLSSKKSLRDMFAKTPEPFVPKNTYAPKMPDHIKRVVVLPVYCEENDPNLLKDFDGIFSQELSRFAYFEVVSVSRNELFSLFELNQINSIKNLPFEFLSTIGKKFNSDGIMFIDMTAYDPYIPMTIGLRAKLVDVLTGKILWASDNFFDGGMPNTIESAKRYQVKYETLVYPLDTGESILQSPSKFVKYAAHAIFKEIRRYNKIIKSKTDETLKKNSDKKQAKTTDKK